jgi:hypothetical protein
MATGVQTKTVGGRPGAAAEQRRRSAAARRGRPELSGRLGQAFTPLLALQACHMAGVTGTLRATDSKRSVTIAFRNGEVVAADSRDTAGLDCLVGFGTWTAGEFEFVAEPPAAGARVRGSFDWMLLEICRQVDEARMRA